MACGRVIFQKVISPPPYSRHNRNLSQFLAASSKSILRLKKQTLLYSPIRIKVPRNHASPVVCAAHTSLSNGWKVVLDGLEEGVNLVPVAIPRLIARAVVYYFAVKLAFEFARIAVYYLAWTLALKMVRSTSFFTLERIAVYYLAWTLALKMIRLTSFFTLALIVLAYLSFDRRNTGDLVVVFEMRATDLNH